MSCIWYVICHEEKIVVPVGQGYGEMSTLWSAETKEMDALQEFLVKTYGKPIFLINEHELDEILDVDSEYKEKP